MFPENNLPYFSGSDGAQEASDEKTGQKRSGQKNINTCKACPERKDLEKMSAGTHPQNHPTDDININENI